MTVWHSVHLDRYSTEDPALNSADCGRRREHRKYGWLFYPYVSGAGTGQVYFSNVHENVLYVEGNPDGQGGFDTFMLRTGGSSGRHYADDVPPHYEAGIPLLERGAAQARIQSISSKREQSAPKGEPFGGGASLK
jgi:hypothetical protein